MRFVSAMMIAAKRRYKFNRAQRRVARSISSRRARHALCARSEFIAHNAAGYRHWPQMNANAA
jgi:hypothetical protein